MPEDIDAFTGRLLIYLSGRNGFVSAKDVVGDRLSGLHSEDEIGPALEKASQFLEFEEDEKSGELFRLPGDFDGYRAVFAGIREAKADISGFLCSSYSKSLVDAGFIGEAVKRVLKLPYFVEMEGRYPPGNRPGDAVALMLSRSPGFDALATMFRASPGVATDLLFPEALSRYELAHLRITLDLAFASDMLKRVPPATSVTIKYEIVAQGMLNLETRGGAGIP